MKKYVALLRAINVGGKNKINMVELKRLFEKNGYTDVVTYINSGNVIFSSDRSKEGLQIQCEKHINKEFNLNIKVILISADDLEEMLNNAPNWWNKDKESKHNAIFTNSSTMAKEIFNEIESKKENEQVYCYENVIFWSAPIKTFQRTRLTKIVHTPICNKATIRNANTTMKLLELMKTN